MPKNILTNDDLARLMDTSDEWISTRTGIKERHIATDETSIDLVKSAAQAALSRANVEAEDLGLIVCATLTADTLTPSLACEVMKELGACCPAFDVNAACSGYLYALEIARKMMGEKPCLVVACEMLSRIVDWNDRSTCVLFGDGACASVLANDGDSSSGIIDARLFAYPDTKGSLVVPGINQKNETGHRPSYVSMNGAEVYKFATRELARGINEILSENGLSVEDVKYFVPHQANIRIIKTAASMMGADMEKFFINIDHTGNTSCASVGIALDELSESGELKPGDIVVLSAFGGGLTSATTLLRW